MEDLSSLYYQGYLIENRYYLDKEEIRLLDTLCWMVDNQSTIGKAAINFEYSCTTLWRKIHKECKYLSYELYDRLLILIDKNKRKGGRKKK